MNVSEITFGNVYATLSQVDLSDYKMKKGKFDYLSWSDAINVMMEYYPQFTYEFLPETYEENGTVMTHCIVRIGHLERSMWLPVMDFNNNSSQNPTTRQIQDARMRCLVKCLAVYGLGLYIFRGEDLPDATKDKEEKAVVTTNYSLVSANGEDLGIYLGEQELMKELRSQLGVKKDSITDDHKAFFRVNKSTIATALQNANGGTDAHTSLNRLVAYYHDVWSEDEEEKTK